MSSSHSGTIGRKRVGSAVSSEFYYGTTGGSGGGGGGGSASVSGTLANGAGGEQMRRQRSAEWHSHRHGHGYGSSSDDEYQNTAQATAFDTQLLAQLLLQSQQLASMEHYNSDCEPDYLRQRNRRSDDASVEVTYAQPHQRPSAKAATTSQSPLKLTTVSASTVGKYQSNANLGLFPSSSSGSGSSSTLTAAATRSTNPFLNAKYTTDEALLDAGAAAASASATAAAATPGSAFLLPASASSSTAASYSRSQRSGAARSTLNRLSGMTSSSSGASALSVNRSDSLREKAQTPLQLQQQLAAAKQSAHQLQQLQNASSDLDEFAALSSGESEPPPEPAPPEIPPRTQSLLMSLRKHSDYKLKYEEKGDQKHEEFIPTSQLQKDYIISDNLRSVEQLKPISPGDAQR